MHEEIVDHLDLMIESTDLIEKRMSRIRVPEDFVLSADGTTMLDAVSMRLQVIGESVRKIQKVDPSFLTHYSTIEWDKLARFRDLVSHHYANIDHEIVYDICRVHIPNLRATLLKIRSDLRTIDRSWSK
jgi:uncharacterized protein with HEPN domain